VKKSQYQHTADFYARQPMEYRMKFWKWLFENQPNHYGKYEKLTKEQHPQVQFAINFWRPK